MKYIYRAILILLLSVSPAFAASYYVDFAAGNNASAGTSTGTAWKNIPGTRNAGDTAYVSASGWPVGKVQAGDIIYLKSGTTHDSSNGGKVIFGSTYYATDATVANPITIMRDAAWGTGAVTFDGTGMTTGGGGWGILHSQIGGVKIDGVTEDGIVVQDSANSGFSHYPTVATEAASLYYMKFYNNGTSYVVESAAEADIKIRHTTNAGTIDHVNIDGNGRLINGTVFGDTDRAVVGYTVSNTTSNNHVGTNDGGFGFKAYNSQITFDNCSADGNYKGWDLGEQTGNGRNITYTVKNSTASNNSFGINMNSSQGTYAGAVNFYLINNIIRGNTILGTNIYAGPYTLYAVHNTFDGNGGSNPSSPEMGNLGVTPDLITDATINVYLYNNIFYKPAGGINFLEKRFWDSTANFNVYSDYNSWVRRSAENFTSWSYYVAPACTYSYGANGPGHASGTWYTNYGCDSAAASNGHFHADANSKGTLADDTTVPPFTDQPNNDYTITSTYAGTDLSSQSWYIAAMGTDRVGAARTEWSIGAYEYAGVDTVPNAFSFTDNTDVASLTVIYSDSITVIGITDNTAISLTGTGCFYQVNGAGSWLTSGDNVYLNDTIALKTTSAASAATPQQTSCTLVLGGSTSDTWYVTTIAVPTIPTLTGPSDDATGVTRPVTFTWNAVTGAELYEIQIATDSAFTDIVIDVQTVNTSYEATTLLPSMRYYWRVRALQ